MGCIIVYFVGELVARPLLGIFSNLSNGIINSIADYYYKSCSNARIELLIIQIAVLGLSIYYFSIIQDSIKTIKEIKEERKECDELEEKINNLGITESENKKEETKEKKSLIETKKDLLGRVSRVRGKGKIIGAGLNVCVILLIISFINMVAFTVVPCVNRIVFEESTIKITPYVEQSEIDTLKSDWTRMKTKEDYQKIDDFIDDVIEKNNLK